MKEGKSHCEEDADGDIGDELVITQNQQTSSNWSMQPQIMPFPPSQQISQVSSNSSNVSSQEHNIIESSQPNANEYQSSSLSSSFNLIPYTVDSAAGSQWKASQLLDASLPSLSELLGSGLMSPIKSNSTSTKRVMSPNSQLDSDFLNPAPSSKNRHLDLSSDKSTDVDNSVSMFDNDNSDTVQSLQTNTPFQISSIDTSNNAPLQNNVEFNLDSHSDDEQTEKDIHTFVIEPQSCNDNPDVESFFKSNISLTKAIKNSKFGTSGILNVTMNPKRKCIIIKTEHLSKEKLAELLAVTKIGTWVVKCRLPKSQTTTIGVIGPLGEEDTDDGITDDLKSQGYPVLSAKRIFKIKNKQPTAMFKCEFEGLNHPEYVYVGFMRLKVSTYVPQPQQCFKCQGFAHSSEFCKGRVKCVICSGPHNYKSCKDKENFCANCGGKHTASYGGCPIMKQAKKVELIRSQKRITYSEATKIMAADPALPLKTHADQISPLFVNTRRSYSSIVQTPSQNRSQITSRTVGCQTDSPAAELQSCKSNDAPMTCVQMALLMWKMLSIKDTIEIQNQPSALNELILETFDVELNPAEIQDITHTNFKNNPSSSESPMNKSTAEDSVPNSRVENLVSLPPSSSTVGKQLTQSSVTPDHQGKGSLKLVSNAAKSIDKIKETTPGKTNAAKTNSKQNKRNQPYDKPTPKSDPKPGTQIPKPKNKQNSNRH